MIQSHVFPTWSGGPVNEKTCQYCSPGHTFGPISFRHLDGCPVDDPALITVWNEGRVAAVTSRDNPRPTDPTFTLGYKHEREAQKDLEAEKTRITHEDLVDPPLAANAGTPAQIVFALQERSQDARMSDRI